MMSEKIGTVEKVSTGLALASLSFLAQAAPDTSAAVSAFDDVGTAIVAIGIAMLAAAGAGIVYRWVTAFLLK